MDPRMYLVDVIHKAPKQQPDVLLSEGLLVVNLSVNVAVVQEVPIDLLHLKSDEIHEY